MIKLHKNKIPKNVILIGNFGSYSRKCMLWNSDIDIVVFYRGEYNNEDKFIEVTTNRNKDIFFVDESVLRNKVLNPKSATMFIDLNVMYKSKNILIKPKINKKFFCAFLEIERLKNMDIFKNKKIDILYVKKMPGGRRSFDEFQWLNKLSEKKFDLKLNPLDIRNEEYLPTASLLEKNEKIIDSKILELENEICDTKAQKRGKDLLKLIDIDLYDAMFCDDSIKLMNLYTDALKLEDMKDWLILYAIASNYNIPKMVALTMSRMNDYKVFAYEFKKGLLQNKGLKQRDFFTNILNILCDDKNSTVSTYANILKDISFLDQLPQEKKEFFKHHISHIL